MSAGGYIKLYRGWRDTDGLAKSETFSDCEAWLWLLENAAWKPLSRWNAKGEEVKLQPGQIHVSLRSLSTAWGWSKSKVERFLSRLERVKKAGRSTGQSGIILTIENWAKYQVGETDAGTASGTVAGQPRDTQEERKERKEGKNTQYAFSGSVIRLLSDDLERFRSTYHAIPDIVAELTSLDAWLTKQPADKRKDWFHRIAGALNRKHQEALAAQRAEASKEWTFTSPC